MGKASVKMTGDRLVLEFRQVDTGSPVSIAMEHEGAEHLAHAILFLLREHKSQTRQKGN